MKRIQGREKAQLATINCEAYPKDFYPMRARIRDAKTQMGEATPRDGP